MGAVWKWLRDDPTRWVWWGGLGLVLVPFVVSAARLLFGVGDDYMPTQDLAVTEMFVRDVGRRSVLVGLYSRADWNHPGPAEFYALAPLYWLTGGASVSTHVGALAINAGSVAGSAAVARRRGGIPVLLATLVGCALVMRTLGADLLSNPWNPYMPVLPYLLLLFLTWSMLCGELWALPVATVVASFTAQTHVGFVALSLPLLLVGGVALTLPEIRRLVGRRSRADEEAEVAEEAEEAEDAEERRRRTAVVRAVLLSAGLFALVWLPPVLDVLWSAPSNARQIYTWFDQAEEGVHTLGDGWRVIGSQFGATPDWIAGKEPTEFTTGEPVELHRAAPLPVLLVLVAGAAALMWRRRVDGARALVVTLGLALVLGIVGVARTVGPAYDYRLRWTWMPPVLAFVLVLWTAWWLLVRWRPAAETRLLVPASLAALLVLGIVNSTAAAGEGTPYPADTAIMAAITPPVLEALDEDHGGIGGDGQVVVDLGDGQLGGHTYGRGLVLQLQRHGIDARVRPSRIRFFPESRHQTDGPVRARLVVAAEEQVDELRDDPDFRLLSLWSPLSEQERDDLFERIAEVDADYEAGRISAVTWLTEKDELHDELHGTDGGIAYSVAVFLDERLGDVGN